MVEDNNIVETNNDNNDGTGCQGSKPPPPAVVMDLLVQERVRFRNAKRRQQRWTFTIVSVSLMAMMTSLLVLILVVATTAASFSSSLILFVAFLLPLGMAPYVLQQRRQLNKIPTLQYILNQLRYHVDTTLTNQNTSLEWENHRLTKEIQRLAQTEQDLLTVTQCHQSNVEIICQLVADHRETIQQMEYLHNARELQTLLTAILSSDLNGDQVLSEQELDLLLTHRLESFSAINVNKIRMALLSSSSSSSSSNTTTTQHSSSSITGLYHIAASTSFGEDHVRTYGAGRILRWLLDDKT